MKKIIAAHVTRYDTGLDVLSFNIKVLIVECLLVFFAGRMLMNQHSQLTTVKRHSLSAYVMPIHSETYCS